MCTFDLLENIERKILHKKVFKRFENKLKGCQNFQTFAAQSNFIFLLLEKKKNESKLKPIPHGVDDVVPGSLALVYESVHAFNEGVFAPVGSDGTRPDNTLI